MTATAAQIFEYDLDVVAEDIDEMDHVNNAVYLKWVQAAVLGHWHGIAPQEVVAAHVWVALKHEIRYVSPAYIDDHVVVRVMLEKYQGARAFYKTLINRGDQLLAEVDSCWACLDAVTKKPARLARDITARFFVTTTP